MTVSPDPRNRLGRDNLLRVGIHHTQISEVNRNTVHECPLIRQNGLLLVG